MSLIGSNWKDEESASEAYRNIVGSSFMNLDLSESELRKEIERKLADPYTSRTERSQLIQLRIMLKIGLI